MDDKLSSNLLSGSLAQTGSKPLVSSSCSQSTSWIIDLGASNHMFNQSQLFTSNFSCVDNLKIRIANGSLSPIVGKGLVVFF